MIRTTVNNLKLNCNEEACLHEMCGYAKNLYNETLFTVNKVYKAEGIHLSHYDSRKYVKKSHNRLHLPASVADYVLANVADAFRSFFERHKSDMNAKPPKYLEKNSEYKLIYDKMCFRVRENGIELTVQQCMKKKFNFPFNGKKRRGLIIPLPKHIVGKDLRTVTILPSAGGFKAAYAYRDEKPEISGRGEMGIDLGVDNFASFIDTVTGSPSIISGKRLKHILHRYNKNVARLASAVSKCQPVMHRGVATASRTKRLRRADEHLRNTVRYILHGYANCVINYAAKFGITTIVVGHNTGWKRGSNILKKNNQNFVMMPHTQFVSYLKYKGELCGMSVMEIDESHTSKCDALALETIEHHDEYIGKRTKRGLFRSSTGRLLNADINGAINILRRAHSEEPLKDFNGKVCETKRETTERLRKLNLTEKEINEWVRGVRPFNPVKCNCDE